MPLSFDLNMFDIFCCYVHFCILMSKIFEYYSLLEIRYYIVCNSYGLLNLWVAILLCTNYEYTHNWRQAF